MGFVFTVIFVVVTIISPQQLGGEWAAYRPELWIAIATALCSISNVLTEPRRLRSVQSYLLAAFLLVIGISQITNGWAGGTLESWLMFLPSATVFFFIVANTTTLRRMKILSFFFVVSCLILVAEALAGYYFGFHGDLFIMRQGLYSHNEEIIGEIFRLRAAGFLNDPNDFAQILIVALPLLFIAWEPRRRIYNFFLVLTPAAALVWAIFLTHSRGALVGLSVIVLFAVRRKLGTTGAAIVTGLLVLGLLGVDFTGGRQISAAEGAGRLDAWATGLELFKGAPLFGIGFRGFTNYNDITAHNSFVLCLAELGFVGSIIWVAMLVSTMLGLNRIIDGDGESLSGQALEAEELEEAEVHETLRASSESASMGNAATVAKVETEVIEQPSRDSESLVYAGWTLNTRLALIGFIATGWFLSRSYTMTLYLVVGLATALIALGPEETGPDQKWRWIQMSFVVEIAAIVLVYVLVRFRH